MWLFQLFFFLGITWSGEAFKLPVGDGLRGRSVHVRAAAQAGGRSELPPKQRHSRSSGKVPDGDPNNGKAAKGSFGFTRPRVGSDSERDDSARSKVSPPAAGAALAPLADNAKSFLVGSTEVVLATLVNTGPVNALLTPLHKWSTSRKRVAEAVEAEREERQRALREEQEEQRRNSPNGLVEFLRVTVTLPRPVKNTYDTLLSVAAMPGELVQTGKQTAESLAAAAAAVGTMPGRVRETVARGQETVKTAQEVLSGAPGRVQEVVEATQELPGRVERALEEGTEAVEAAVDAGRRASEAIETLPERLPELIETLGEDALSLAEGTAEGVDAAGAVLWGATKEAVFWAAERVLRQALAPVHEYRTSAKRVQAALDAQLGALPAGKGKGKEDSPSVEEGASNTALLAKSPPSVAQGSKVFGEEMSRSDSDVGDILPRPVGLRGRLSSWRRKRRSIAAVAEPVADEEDHAGEDNANVGSAASSLSKKAVSAEAPRGVTAPAAGRAEVSTEEISGSGSANARGAAVVMVPTAPTPAVKTVLPGNDKSAEEEVSPTAAGPAAYGGAEASSKEAVSRAPPGASATSVSASAAPEYPAAAAEVAPVARAPRPVVSGGLEGEKGETSVGAKGELIPVPVPVPVGVGVVGDAEEKPLDTLKPGPDAAAPAGEIEPREGGAEVAKGQEPPGEAAAAAAARRLRIVAEREDGGTGGGSDESGSTRKEQEVLPLPSAAPVVAPSQRVLANDDDGKDSLVSGLEAGTPEKMELPPPTRSGREEAAARASARKSVQLSAAPTGAGKDLDVVAPSSPFEISAGDSAAVSLPLPALPPRAATPTAASTQTGNLETETATEPQEREEADTVAGQTVSDMKPPVLPSTVADDSAVSAVAGAGDWGAATAVAKDKAGEVGGGGKDGAKRPVNPAAEFLKDWMDKAVPQKKAELKQRESAVCWERQWYPVGIVSELLQQHRRLEGENIGVRFQMLGQSYELRKPIAYGGQATSAWSCRTVGSSSAGPAEVAETPVRESNGLLWAWPDISPEGLAAAAATLATLAPLRGFSDAGGEGGGGGTPGPWRRLLRRQTARQQAAENGHGGPGRTRKRRGKRRHVVLVEREVSCRYSDAVRGLLAASHGQAVRAVAAGGNGDGSAEEDEGLSEAAASLAGGYNSSSSVFQAAFGMPRGHGEVLFHSPTTVEWRFSPAASSPPTREPVAAAAPREMATATATASQDDSWNDAVSPRRSWLRRRLSGLGGEGDSDDGARGGGRDSRAGEEIVVRHGGAAHYVASVLPAGPNRTRVFARLEMEPAGLLDGRSLWWSKRIRHGLLAAALDDAASGRANRFSSAAVEEWLEGATQRGPC